MQMYGLTRKCLFSLVSFALLYISRNGVLQKEKQRIEKTKTVSPGKSGKNETGFLSKKEE
jgi:hypothetical protein